MKFEAFKAEDGTFRWHLRDERGNVVSVKLGKVMLPRTSAGERQRYRQAMQDTLAKIASGAVKV